MDYTKLSKFLSLVLRHNPSAAGITVDKNGWANVAELIKGVNGTGRKINMAMLEEIVATNEKQRYSFNENKTKIRANQGHSLNVDLELKPITPPDILYHGTASRSYKGIMQQGLVKCNRTHVHLSADIETAVTVGTRHGFPIVLQIDAKQMQEDGHLFYLSANGVWLTENVPVKYIIKIQ